MVREDVDVDEASVERQLLGRRDGVMLGSDRLVYEELELRASMEVAEEVERVWLA
jgi:hypothetical protein